MSKRLDDFDQLIKKGNLVKAARLFAKEGYENGEFGFTRKQLIDSLANRVESLEEEKVGMAELVDDSVEISWEIEQKNKQYQDSINLALNHIHTGNFNLATIALNKALLKEVDK